MPDSTQTLPDTIEAADDALLSGDGAPETSGQEPAPAVSPEPATPDRPRDDQGRFTENAPPAPEVSPTPGPSSSPEPSPEPVAAAVPASPFTYAGDGQDIEIPGSAVGDDGVFIPVAEVPRLQRLLAQGQAWDGSAQHYIREQQQRQQQLESRAQTAEEQTQAVEAQLTKILGHFEQLVEASVGVAPEQLFETPLAKWLLGVREGWGVLKAEAKADRIERERQSDRRQLEEYQQRQRDAELKPQMAKTLSDHILYMGQQVGLDRPAMEDIYADLNSPQFEKVTWIQAQQDDPLNGIRKGETVLNLETIQRMVARAKAWRGPQTNGQPRAEVPKPAAPVKKPTPPPMVSATRGPSPRKVLAEPASKEEADRWLSEGGNDPD